VLSTQSVIWSLSYDNDAENIVLTVNSSLKEWNLCLMQIVKNKKQQHVCKYDSEIWFVTESVYNAEKWECCNLLKFLKKVQAYLYEVFFIIELNTQTLVAQLNCSVTDVLDVLINYWLVWIQLFNFDIQHVSKKKHQALNTLSWWLQMNNEDLSNNDEKKFLNSQLFHFSVHTYFISINHVTINKFSLITISVLNLNSNYSKEQKQIAKYLTTLKRSADMKDKKFIKFKTKILQYLVQKVKLFWRVSKNMNIKRVVNNVNKQKKIVRALHNQISHKRVKSIYWWVFSLYWWEKLYWQVKDHCQHCEDCQWHDKILHSDSIFSIFTSTLFKKMIINVIKLSMCWDKHYIVVIHKDLSKWIEAQALAQATSSTVTCFLWENIITQHKLFNKLICDSESENKMWIKNLTDLYRIDCIMMSVYNSDVNSMMKCEHKFLIDELKKITNKDLEK